MKGEFTISSKALEMLQMETGWAIPKLKKRIRATLASAPDHLPETEIGSSSSESLNRGDLLLNQAGLVDVVSSVLTDRGITGFGVTLHSNGQIVRVIRGGELTHFFALKEKG